MKQHFQTCVATHAMCDRFAFPAGTYRPSRLIHVAGDGNAANTVRLVEGRYATEGGYATLSHCWGGASFLCLTVDNESALQAGIAPTDLPLSFTDAIRVSRQLGIPYLWIDCLCII